MATKNLGRVKGDSGTSYIPHIIINNGKQYVTYEANDGTELPSSLQGLHEFNSYVYVPYLDSDGNLTFSLSNNVNEQVSLGNIKGEPGKATIGTIIVQELPNPATLSDEDKNLIYIIDNDNAYLDAAVYSPEKDDFVFVELVLLVLMFISNQLIMTKNRSVWNSIHRRLPYIIW